ncbi:hypothetical protein [Mucilaginibacter sp.]|uniref:hypothetical protein n=1 Tax=Mucilaginibacter sp. TaxID=1882438 RepID=UPI0028451D30|nr:hypothetical protein [Mucilaginibacter sp.]MDR3696027.1 hypothetical protein [Mucilaginibacter sp.]
MSFKHRKVSHTAIYWRTGKKRIMKLNTLHKIAFFGLLFSIALASTSCKKSASPTVHPFSANGIILDKGNLAADGCGWQITVADSTYSPQNLASEFQVNNLKVHIAFHKLKSRLYCSMVANNQGKGITEIQIDSIGLAAQ